MRPPCLRRILSKPASSVAFSSINERQCPNWMSAMVHFSRGWMLVVVVSMQDDVFAGALPYAAAHPGVSGDWR